MKKYRQSFHELGKTTTHYGLANDRQPPKMVYGRETDKSEAASDLVNPPMTSPLTEYFNTKNEGIYASRYKEPLGKTINRSHKLPEFVNDESFKFGVKAPVDVSAKELIFPQGDIYHVDDEAHKLYVQTHKSYNPGEQMKRYKEGIPMDPTEHRFGKFENKELDGVKKSLHPSVTDKQSGFNNEPAIVNKIQQEYLQFHRDPLGKSRHHVLTNNDLPERVLDPNHVFGTQSKPDPWGASECIKGNYTAEQQQPDADLGKTVHTFRTTVPPTEPDRTFGCPTIRYDIKAPRNRSISDNNNYGNEPNAHATMYPSKYSRVTEDDFDTLVPRQNIKDVIMSSGCLDSEEEFDHIYDYALTEFAHEIDLVRRRDRNTSRPLSPKDDIDCMTVDLFRRALAQFTIDHHQRDLESCLRNL